MNKEEELKKEIEMKWHKHSSSFTNGDILDNQQIILKLLLRIKLKLEKKWIVHIGKIEERIE